ncbi:MAG TPA: YiiD C-terminal domain-containing protein [Gemmatimonadales bacterium]|nr:YiiD C-terminal domain-containing protein [Gemmatimonadales bacterium]
MTAALDLLQRTIDARIPIARQLQARVASHRDGSLALAAPLAPNVNHRGTAFAGSLNALATLAGWGALWLLLHEAGLEGRIVLQDSAVRYLRPVTRDFTARTIPFEPAAVERLIVALRRRGRARLAVGVEIADNGRPAVTFHGRYVVLAAGTADGDAGHE